MGKRDDDIEIEKKRFAFHASITNVRQRAEKALLFVFIANKNSIALATRFLFLKSIKSRSGKRWIVVCIGQTYKILKRDKRAMLSVNIGLSVRLKSLFTKKKIPKRIGND